MVPDAEPAAPDPGSPRPDHLLVWLTGAHPGGDDPVVLDAELGDGFSLEPWVAEVQDGYPEAVVAVAWGGDERWIERIRTVVGTGAPVVRRFTGATRPHTLTDVRRWAAAVVEDLVPDDEDLVGRVVLLVHELATNVEAHARGWLAVDVVPTDDGLVVAVTDPRPITLPRPTATDHVASRHDVPAALGLVVVTGLADGWGLVVRPATKTVWARIATVGPSPAGAGRHRRHQGAGHGRRVPDRRDR
jgi:anti-sigma regulatory factor (Ser/Thr protein kinase)